MAEQKRAVKGVWIPIEIWENENLSIQEKVILAEIDSFCSRYESCYASNEHFAKFIGVSSRRVRDILKSLEDKHLIERKVIYKKGTKEIEKRFLRLPYPPGRKLPQGGEENFRTPQEENCLDNNTVTNNTKEGIYTGAKPTKKRKAFIPPSLDDVKAYVAEKGLSVDAQRFFDYYEAGNWHDGKGNAVKNWKQKCLTWDKHTDSKPVTTTCKTRTSNVVADPEEYKRQQEALEAQARAELFGTMGCSQ